MMCGVTMADELKPEAIIERMNLEASNAVLIDYWLSLWADGKPPPRAKLSLTKIKQFLPGILLFEVIPDQRVTVRLAGTGYRYILKKDPTGEDWIAAAPQDHRATRLKIFSAVARGAILVAHRRIAMLRGQDMISEEILVPFLPDPTGAVPVLARVNFSEGDLMRIKSISQVTGDPIDYKLVSLVP